MVFVAAIAGQAMLISDARPAVVGGTFDKGRAIYEKFCASCHGVSGDGEKEWQRRNGFGELPAPPHDATGHTWKHADGMLYRIVRDGWRDPFNKSHRLTMPAYKNVLEPGEIRDVINFLKTMWMPAQRMSQKAESKAAPFPSEASKVAPGLRGRERGRQQPSKESENEP